MKNLNDWEKYVPTVLKYYNDSFSNKYHRTSKKTHLLIVEGRSDKELYVDIFENNKPYLGLENIDNIKIGRFPNAFLKINNIEDLNSDCRNVQFVVKFMEEFNRMKTDKQYIDCYGFIDRDFYHEISNLSQIKKTTEHDSETNLIWCYMPLYINEISDDNQRNEAIDIFSEVFAFCVEQGILEKTSFDYQKQYADSFKIGKIIRLSHSYFKKNCDKECFVNQNFDDYLAKNSDCFDEHFREIYGENKKEIRYLSEIHGYCVEWIHGQLENNKDKDYVKKRLKKLLEYCNGHIFLNQLIMASKEKGDLFNLDKQKPFTEEQFSAKLREMAFQNPEKMFELMPLKEYVDFRKNNNYLYLK